MKRLAAAFTLAPTLALAHPGDHRASDLWHLANEPVHLAMIAAVVAGLGYLVYRWARS